MLPVSEYSKPPKIVEKGCLRARIHYPALKFQQLAILTCAHGCVFSMHKEETIKRGLQLTDKRKGISLYCVIELAGPAAARTLWHHTIEATAGHGGDGEERQR